jgi:hypothetical protein
MNEIESFLIGLDHLNAMADPWHMRDPTDAQRADVAAQMTGMLRLLNRTRAAENAPQEATA